MFHVLGILRFWETPHLKERRLMVLSLLFLSFFIGNKQNDRPASGTTAFLWNTSPLEENNKLLSSHWTTCSLLRLYHAIPILVAHQANGIRPSSSATTASMSSHCLTGDQHGSILFTAPRSLSPSLPPWRGYGPAVAARVVSAPETNALDRLSGRVQQKRMARPPNRCG